MRLEPIRNLDTIRDMERTLAALTDDRGRRLFLLFEVGIRMGLRIGDMVSLRVGDLRGQRTYTFVPQKQARKAARRHDPKLTLTVDPQLRKILSARTADQPDSAWLFPSRTRTVGGNPRHITRQTAYEDLQRIQQLTGCPVHLGCHSLRKTFGYQYYQKSRDIAFLQEWFYHSSPATTLIYIGVNEDNFRRMTDANPYGSVDDLPL